jgi:hypothetical protein
MINKDTDNYYVLKHLTRYGSITEEYAKYKLGIKRLSARINDLKNAGYNVTTKLKKVIKMNGKPTRVTDKYVMEGVV